MKHILRNTCILLVVIANAGCDQIAKQVARKNLAYYETVDVIGKHFVLTKIENSGAFLSTGDSLSGIVKLIFLSIIPLAALLYGIYFLFTHRELPRLLVLGICFVIGGGLGNLYDRLRFGSVTDFLHIDFYLFKTGIFNLADVSIMIGMGMLVTNLYFKRRKPEQTEDELAEG